MSDLIFPPGFLWGVATSAYQIEGAVNEDGRGESIWDRFCHTSGKVLNGDTGDIACDHYHLYPEDIAIMKSLGIEAYRFSVAWPRIFPEGKGRPNPKGVDFYKRLIDMLLDAGIKPCITMFHWDLPQSLEDKGGWFNRDTAYRFRDYAVFCVKELGCDDIPLWMTLNEPEVIIDGYTSTRIAPCHDRKELIYQVGHHVLLAHGLAVEAYRNMNLHKSEIGIVTCIWPHYAADEHPDTLRKVKMENDFVMQRILYPVCKGEYAPEYLARREKDGFPLEIEPGDLKLIGGKIDFLGINHYSRTLVSADPAFPSLEERVRNEPQKFTGFNWEIYPPAIYDTLLNVKKISGDRKIYITENGAAFPDSISPDGAVHDSRRVNFLREYLIQINRAIASGVDVRGYFLWSLLDNFEWMQGYSQRFGIVYVDFTSQKRIVKDSGYWYRDLILANRR